MIAKLTTLALVLLSLTWLCRAPDWEPAISSIVFLSAYLGIEYRSQKKSLTKHDINLMETFRSNFQKESGTLRMLRDHDMAVPFRRENLDPVFNFNETWRGADYEFDDQELESRLKSFKKKCSEYGLYVALNTYPDRVDAKCQTMDYKEKKNTNVREEIREKLNTLGNELHAEYESVVRTFRKKLKEAELGGAINSEAAASPR